MAVAPLQGAPTALTRVRTSDDSFGFGPNPLTQPNVGASDGGASICADLCPDFVERATLAIRQGVARQFGHPTEDIATSVIYSGPVDAEVARASEITDAAAGELRLFVAHSRLPNGAMVRDAILVHSGGDGNGGVVELENATPISAANSQGRPYVLFGNAQGEDSGLIAEVIAPGAVTAQLKAEDPASFPGSAKSPLVDGRARLNVGKVLPLSGARVVTFDAAGRELGNWLAVPPAAERAVFEAGETEGAP
ncbi:hypothetical protein V6K52_16820 [Knoellia sp. S7-12]|uniref:hypothetical protein n=1 Tax=Knoellia sp. S7-12 TaxID=3126698 RepID=UPI003366282C